MLFWLGILAGFGFVAYAYKQGLFSTWAMLFNVTLAIYLGLALSPLIAELVPASAESSLGEIVVVVAIAVVIFLIFHTITYVAFTAQFTISLPKILDVLGSGILSFLIGLLVFSFAAMIIILTPFSESAFAKKVGLDQKSAQTNINYLSSCCDKIHNIIGNSENDSTKDMIDVLIAKSQKMKKVKAPADPNSPKNPKIDANDTQ